MTQRSGLGVVVEGATRIFGEGLVAFEDLTLRVEPGEFVALLGPSGCGKSTLLRGIAGLDRLTRGRAEITGARTPGSVAFVFQDAHLLPWRSLLDNTALPLELIGVARDERHARAAALLSELGLDGAFARYPNELSGGMRMRASLARALATEPALLLLDEPFAALDELTRGRLDDLLRALWARRRMTVLFVTHSIAEATYLAERAIVLSKRPARVLLDHPIALPAERSSELRGSPELAREAHVLFRVLEGDDA